MELLPKRMECVVVAKNAGEHLCNFVERPRPNAFIHKPYCTPASCLEHTVARNNNRSQFSAECLREAFWGPIIFYKRNISPEGWNLFRLFLLWFLSRGWADEPCPDRILQLTMETLRRAGLKISSRLVVHRDHMTEQTAHLDEVH